MTQPASRLAVLLTGFLGLAAVAGCRVPPEEARQKYLASGDAYAAQEKYAEAIIEYRNAIQQDARSGEAHLKLADACLKTGDFSNAFRNFVRAADLMPEDDTAQLKAGGVRLLARQFEDAKARADAILERSPGHVDALILKANALAGLNQIDDAVAEVEQAIANDPARSESYTSLGAMQAVRGNVADAEAAYTKAVAADPDAVSPRLAYGNFLWTIGRHDAAEKELKRALELAPTHAIANRLLAYFYISSGRSALAEPHLRAVAEVTTNASGKFALANYYLLARRTDDARRVLEDIVANDQAGSATAQLRLAALDVGTGDIASATRRVDAVLAAHPAHADALIASAQLLANAGRLDEALSAARRAAEADPRSARAQYALGRVYMARHQETDAFAAFTAALRADPRMAAAEVEIARLHLAAGRLADAEQFARSAIGRIAGYADAHLLLARIHLLKREPARAEASLTALSRAFPASSAVQTEVGLLELRRGNLKAARAAFTRVLQQQPAYVDALAGLTQIDLVERHPQSAMTRLDAAMKASPSNPRLLRLAAVTWISQNDDAHGEALLRQAIEIEPNEFESYALLGQLYARQGRLSLAVAEFDRAAERQSHPASAFTAAGILLEMQQQTADARVRYERALAASPTAAVAANNLAWIYAHDDSPQLDRALELAQIAKSRLPDVPSVNDTLGWIYYKKGLHALAVPLLLEAVQKAPDAPQYHHHLGEAYAAAGETGKARAALERALALNSRFDGAAQARATLDGLADASTFR